MSEASTAVELDTVEHIQATLLGRLRRRDLSDAERHVTEETMVHTFNCIAAALRNTG